MPMNPKERAARSAQNKAESARSSQIQSAADKAHNQPKEDENLKSSQNAPKDQPARARMGEKCGEKGNRC
jgi:hypothetical protein